METGSKKGKVMKIINILKVYWANNTKSYTDTRKTDTWKTG